MGWTSPDPPLPPPKRTPSLNTPLEAEHGDVWLDPNTTDAYMYDGIIEKWFKMTYEQYLQYKGKLPPAPVAMSGVYVPKLGIEPPPVPEEPKEKPIEDFGFEDDLFKL